MPSSEFVISRMQEFVEKEGEQVTISSNTPTFDDATQKTTQVYSDQIISKAFVTGPKKDFLGSVRNEEAELVLYVVGGVLNVVPKKNDKVTIGAQQYQVLDSNNYRIRGTIVLVSINIKR